jgi:hypothetical protein
MVKVENPPRRREAPRKAEFLKRQLALARFPEARVPRRLQKHMGNPALQEFKKGFGISPCLSGDFV